MESRRSSTINESEIRKLFASAPPNAINLSLGQPNWPPSEELLAAAREVQVCAAYPSSQGYLPLREKIARKNRFVRGPENVLITAGASAGLTLALLTCADPGSEVIIPDPYFISYKPLVTVLGLKPVFVDTYPVFRVSPEAINEKITSKTKIVILNSPSNPTGVVQRKQDVIGIAQLCQDKGITLLSDEVYSDLVFDELDHAHYSPALDFDNVVTINSFSKAAAVPGWRVGWATGSLEIIKAMTKLTAFVTAGANLPSQIALANVDVGISNQLAELRQKRDLLYNALRKNFELVKPSGAFYAFIKSPSGSATEFAAKLLANGLVIVPGKGFSQRDTHFRISYTVSEEKLRKAIEILLSAI